MSRPDVYHPVARRSRTNAQILAIAGSHSQRMRTPGTRGSFRARPCASIRLAPRARSTSRRHIWVEKTGRSRSARPPAGTVQQGADPLASRTQHARQPTRRTGRREKRRATAAARARWAAPGRRSNRPGADQLSASRSCRRSSARTAFCRSAETERPRAFTCSHMASGRYTCIEACAQLYTLRPGAREHDVAVPRGTPLMFPRACQCKRPEYTVTLGREAE